MRLGRLFLLGPLVANLLVGCSQGARGSGSGEPTVVAALYPLAFAAEEVGGDLVEVESLTPPGVEPHDLELTADQVGALAEADLVLYLGGGFQPAIEDVLSDVDESMKLDLLEGRSIESEESDPHVWLDPSHMADIAEAVAQRLSEIEPTERDTFEENAESVTARLDDLESEFQAGLAMCESRDIVVSHAAFGYLADRYDLNEISISGIDPEAEPTPEQLADVTRFVRDNDVSTIFFEELVSPDVAETIAEETGAQTAMLNPLESAPDNGDYFDAMLENLQSLRQALGCE